MCGSLAWLAAVLDGRLPGIAANLEVAATRLLSFFTALTGTSSWRMSC
jgi:hypothetical protein